VNAFLLLLIWLFPLLLVIFAGRRYASWTLLLAPLPALVAAVVLPVGATVSLPWLLLGVELGLDDTGRVFLLFSALLWLVASLYSAGSPAGENAGDTRFRIFFLLAMAGNLGLIVAQDMVSFYLGFTLMGLAAYGLIVHPGSQRARVAARRYLVWTIAGELVLFIAVVMLAAQHDGALSFSVLETTPPAGFVVLLLVIGFGIKLALPGLHFWLPQAYAVAPAPAVAVLSGAMIKTGLLGWIRFLPVGGAMLAGWGQALIVIGVTGIFFGAILGLMQHRPRLILGYSSISKMGVLTTGMGAALAWPATAPVLTGALALYAAHHALVKGALFLGLGLVERGGLRPWVLAGLGLLALSLAGAPLTSGALAKSLLTTGLPVEAQYLVSLFAVSAFATTLLMARFLLLVWAGRRAAPSRYPLASAAAWLALLAMIAVVPFALAGAGQLSVNAVPVSLGALLALLVLLSDARMPVRGATHKQRNAATHVALRSARDMQALRRVTAVCENVRLLWLNAYPTMRQAPGYRRLLPRQSIEGENPWPLAGSLWLVIGALLLVAFALMA
jgi:formate hydrogenlyase subunit 3/multisubunit Na+/H+ antiporter MnhD subunit